MQRQMIGNLDTKLRIVLSDYSLSFTFLQDCIKVDRSDMLDNGLYPAMVNWSAIGSQDGDTTREFAKFLDMAAGIAETLNYTITTKADFERVRLIPYPDKVKQQDSILIAELGGEIVVMYPGKWVE